MATSLVLLVLVGCARRWRRAWPAVAGGVLAAVVLVASFVYPVLVEPLFNDFHPLPDGSLRTQILELADQEGVAVDDVLVADASRRTTTLNAYVSGFGGTRRVVVYDNLVEDLPEAEALSVVAHELAHARHRDVVTGSVLGAAGALFGVGLLSLVVGAMGERRRLSMADPAVVPLVLALAAVATFVASPVAEHRQPADRDPRRRRRARDDRGLRRVRRDAAPARAAVLQRPDAAGVVAVLVRQPPDLAAADRGRAAAGRDATADGNATRPPVR